MKITLAADPGRADGRRVPIAQRPDAVRTAPRSPAPLTEVRA
ncbi:hypothetical protein [Streptomyces sioyaensis]|nr:hypothetical protein [Streptomyces sioyaensis]